MREGIRNLVLVALLAGAVGTAKADLAVSTGHLSGANVKGSAIYRAFNSTGTNRIVVDNVDITCAPCTPLTGASNSINYGAGTGTRSITFEYDGSTKTLKSVYTRGTTVVTTSETYTADLGDLNYLAFEVKNAGGGATPPVVSLSDVVVTKGATTLTQVPSIGTVGVAQIIVQKHATGENLTGGFKVSANLNISGTPGGGDSAYVLLKVGYSTPPDDQAPIVSNVHLTPATPLLNGTADVEATVDDTDRGDNTIASADYKLDAGSWTPMAASDGGFDQVIEDVTETTASLTDVGEHTVCVRGTDSVGNQSGTDPTTNDGNNPCLDFIVAYAFDGFYQPVDNDNTNSAQAGRAVPFKWRLTDANGNPISDPDSFVSLWSYVIDCDTLAGDITDSVEEYAAGSSGLPRRTPAPTAPPCAGAAWSRCARLHAL